MLLKLYDVFELTRSNKINFKTYKIYLKWNYNFKCKDITQHFAKASLMLQIICL